MTRPRKTFIHCHFMTLKFALVVLFFCTLNTPALAETLRYVIDDYPPKEIYLPEDDGSTSFTGIDVEIAQALAQKLQLKLVFYPCPFKRCLQMMKDGKADLQSSLLKRPDREKYMYYLDQPYETRTPKAFYLRQNSAIQINQYEDLYQLKRGVGHLLGGKYFPRFDQDRKLIKISFKDVRHTFNMLDKGRVDAVINTGLTGDYFITQLGMQDQIKKANYQFDKATSAYFTISKKSPLASRIDKINQVMKQLIDDGTVNRIKQTYAKRYGID